MRMLLIASGVQVRVTDKVDDSVKVRVKCVFDTNLIWGSNIRLGLGLGLGLGEFRISFRDRITSRAGVGEYLYQYLYR